MIRRGLCLSDKTYFFCFIETAMGIDVQAQNKSDSVYVRAVKE